MYRSLNEEDYLLPSEDEGSRLGIRLYAFLISLFFVLVGLGGIAKALWFIQAPYEFTWPVVNWLYGIGLGALILTGLLIAFILFLSIFCYCCSGCCCRGQRRRKGSMMYISSDDSGNYDDEGQNSSCCGGHYGAGTLVMSFLLFMITLSVSIMLFGYFVFAPNNSFGPTTTPALALYGTALYVFGLVGMLVVVANSRAISAPLKVFAVDSFLLLCVAIAGTIILLLFATDVGANLWMDPLTTLWNNTQKDNSEITKWIQDSLKCVGFGAKNSCAQAIQNSLQSNKVAVYSSTIGACVVLLITTLLSCCSLCRKRRSAANDFPAYSPVAIFNVA